MPKKLPKKNDNFSHFAKHRFIKKPVMLQPPFFWKNVFFNLGFLKPKTMMLNKKHNSKSGKTKIRKRDFKEKTRQETQKREHFDEEKKFQFNIFMLFFSRNKSTEDRTKKETKTRKKKKAKKERQEGRKKDKSKTERQRKRKWKRGRPKKVKGERKGNTENKPNNALFRGKNRFFSIKNKERKGSKKKENKQKKQTKKTNKEGLGPSEVALRATSPDP